MSRATPFLILLLIAALLGGCGFQLRGSADLPPILQATWLDAGGVSTELQRQVRQSLGSGGAVLVDDRATATARLRITGERYQRRTAEVDARGNITEFELRYTFRFSLFDEAAGASLIDEAVVEVERTLRYDDSQLLARESEEADMRAEMVRFAVHQMVRRIEAVAHR